MKQIDVTKLKNDFPILSRKIEGNNLVYLDNAATSQKPQAVLDAIVEYYSKHNANVHRGAHVLGDEATQAYEDSRKKVAEFIGARLPKEIVFTKNSTDSLNQVASGFASRILKRGGVILTTGAEHNSNLLPWLSVAKQTGAKVEFLTLDESGELSMNELRAKLNDKVKLVVVFHASNVLGTILDIKSICSLAHEVGAKVVVDGSQAIPHLPINVQSLGCDFYAFSGHKMLGPMGIGVLWGREELLEQMSPVNLGGGMILEFDLEDPKWLEVPEKFEAGTPNVEGAVGLAAAIDYLNSIGMQNIREHEIALSKYAIEKLATIPNLTILGPTDPTKRTGLVSFVIKDIHAHDIAAVLSQQGICVRSGMHCAMKFHKDLNLAASTRASYYLYNDTSDIDALVDGVRKALQILK
ncbi:MAG TPA: cysteine desulfurase [Candidatus Saccharimonadales bacterium]|nr:cysteine desulfurase [Candidatus Saccharimonadales bacterium]